MVSHMEKIRIENLSVRYADGTESLKNVTLGIQANAVTAIFGPANGGKSTLLRTLNRLNDLADGVEISGRVLFDDRDVLDPNVNTHSLRRSIGMVFSRPVPLPLSIYENIVYGLRVAGEHRKSRLDEAVKRSLKQAALWDEVYNRLGDSAYALSGGQQQRLCLARSLAMQPEVILLDEPTSALDPVSTAKIEQTLEELKDTYTIVIAPHNTQQASRVADYAAFFLQGELVECAEGPELFTNPKDKRTQDYIMGRFG
jgi:phosphate transport system ATP-binding protein